jgi:hypothetical protein
MSAYDFRLLERLVRAEGLSSRQMHELARLWRNLSPRQRPLTFAQWRRQYIMLRPVMGGAL